MLQPEVSVVIINYNTFRLTCSCIRSVQQFTQGVSYEIILVDNASEECDPALFLREFPAITLVCNNSNTGFAAGNNAGIQRASGKFILLLNSDTELKEDSISVCVEELRKEPRTAVVSCRLIYPDGKVQRQCERFPNGWRSFLEASRLFRLLPAAKRAKLLQGGFFSCDQRIHPDWVWGAFFLVRREAVEELPEKKLSERFFMYGEDMEWCFLFRKNGWNVLFTPVTSVVHHIGGSAVGAEKKLEQIAAHQKEFILAYLGRRQWRSIRRWRMLNYYSLRKKYAVMETLYRIYRAL